MAKIEFKVNNTRASFLQILKYILFELDLKNLYSSEPGQLLRRNHISIAPEHRFDIVLDGNKHMIYHANNEINDIMMKEGDIHYCPPYNWKLPVWDSLHEMSSILFGKNYVRVTYINYDKYSNYFETRGATLFYVTSKSVNPAGFHLLSALQSCINDRLNISVKNLIRPILELAQLNLTEDYSSKMSKSYITWMSLYNYTLNNFQHPINRAHVAAEFNLAPSYISRLFMRETKQGFTETLRELRLQYAAKLLSEENLSIEEITEQCGYLSKTFFTSAFKKYHGKTPGQFRHDNYK